MGACCGKNIVVERAGTLEALPTVLQSTPRSKAHKGDGISRSQFILDKPGNINDLYKLESKKLGEGTYGTVKIGVQKNSGAKRAVKIMSKSHLKTLVRFRQEVAIMKTMDHPNIIKLYEVFEDACNMYLVMELCTGGELFDRIIEAGHFAERDAAFVMQHILRAIFYMHKVGTCHRDLKPENFLFLSKDPIQSNVLKIIDFGLATYYEDGGKALVTKAGTPYYVAPEVLKGQYDRSCDLWSCGVIMYTILCGYPPFYGKTDEEILRKVRLGSFAFDPKGWREVSEDAKALITYLLRMDSARRYTAEQALLHDWIRYKAPHAKEVSLQDSLVANLRSFQSQSKLKKAALQIIAGQLSESQIKGLREAFVALDANGDGLLTMQELKDGLERANLRDAPIDLNAIMEGIDADGSGLIDYTEFLAASLDRKAYLQEDLCFAAFNVFDENGDGKITLNELQRILDNGSVSEVVGNRSTQEILKVVDRNGDGSIDFQEFMEMMRSDTQCP
eukprot:TRINITY_DN1211_c1_g1_i1.p1 TRINITY_DN1211_c1_g1~~TRINITY_DN1211_c1_g1_i1.p1  ORF type:complete len:504 (+),score=117.78 TRINITY_DN1211_c1_g1_i1:110-1621(+)